MEELGQAALQYISSAELVDLGELTSSINARHDELVRVKATEEEAARVKAAEEANEVVMAANNGNTERLRTLLKANPNLVDSVPFRPTAQTSL